MAVKSATPNVSKVSNVPKVSKSERTEAAIVDAALDLFANQGYETTTMRQIAERGRCVRW